MNGPYDYNLTTLDKEITQTLPGYYALGRLDLKNNFVVEYVGKFSSDVRGELKEHLKPKYKNFKFSYVISSKESYSLKEIV